MSSNVKHLDYSLDFKGNNAKCLVIDPLTHSEVLLLSGDELFAGRLVYVTDLYVYMYFDGMSWVKLMTSVISVREVFTVDTTIVNNNFIDLLNEPLTNEIIFVYLNGILMSEGSGEDYVINLNRISFSCEIQINDKIIAIYKIITT